MSLASLAKQSALDLTVKGSIGEFSVEGAGDFKSIPVKYILTHVGFDESNSSGQKLFETLKPVREVFELSSLSFDEIMQRDIDDSRVSNKLIPYLLEKSPKGLVKLFPPIIAIVVPHSAKDKKPLKLYPAAQPNEMVKERVFDKVLNREVEYLFSTTGSGDVGNECFQFRQFVSDGILLDHDFASLKLNSSNSSLVVVDGQHRAMALLALYRNRREWPSNVPQHIIDYYRQWDRDSVEDYKLSGVKLPVMICVFPTLCENQLTNGVDVREACRSIFLALNKTAKPVSRSRNLLLDDRDLISEFLREFLNEVKMDTTREDSLSIVNFEVDSQMDKVKLTSPLCISGVMHLYEIIERLLLTSETSYGLSSGSSRLGNIKKLNEVHSEFRLNTFERFGDALVSDELDRNNYGDTARDLLKEAFNSRYVDILKQGFSKFHPFHIYIKAVDDFSGHLIANSMREIRDLLYDGQSGVSNLHAHHEELLEKVNSASSSQQFQRNLDIAKGKIKLIDDQVEILKDNIIRSFAKYPERDISPGLFNAIGEIYQNTFNTNAFQSAFFCTFFFTIERLHSNEGKSLKEYDSFFADYLLAQNLYFEVKDEQDLKRMIKVLKGDYSSAFNSKGMKFNKELSSFREILIPGELKPSDWFRFRPLLLEVWALRATGKLKSYLDEELCVCQAALLKQFIDVRSNIYATSLNKSVEDLTDKQKGKIEEDTKEIFKNIYEECGFPIRI